jgi:menaquinone-dependent protoporphyrinogen oxidase
MAVLVLYASAQGSTREIAEHIAARLRGALGEAGCLSMEEAEGVSGYDAVVLGSAIHNQEWLPAALSFVRRYSSQLAGVPVWAFSVGMADGLPKLIRKRAGVLQQTRLAESLRREIHFRDHKLFSGVYQSSQMPPLLRILFRAAGGRFGDLRDWAAIDDWADQITAQLPKSPSPGSSDSIGP